MRLVHTIDYRIPTVLNNSNQDKELLEKIKDETFNLLRSSTSHGLPRIVTSKKLYLKVIWILAFITSTVACIYVIVRNLMTFFEYNVSVSTTIEIESPTYFPAITICNLNVFNTVRALQFLSNTASEYNLSCFRNSTIGKIDLAALKQINMAMDRFKSEAATNPVYNETERMKLGFYLDEMLISCNYAGVDCDAKDFKFFQSYDYGNCYTFNGDQNNSSRISTSGPGFGNGLVLELFNGDDPSVQSCNFNQGFYVVVHNKSSSPILENEGINVASGTDTYIAINREFYTKLSSPYSSCIENPTAVSSSDSLLYKAILSQLEEKSYRQKYCYKLCHQKFVINTCFCYDPKYANPFPIVNSQKISSCRTHNETACKKNAKLVFDTSAISSQCSDLCPLECSTVSYSTTVSTAQYPTDSYLELLLQTDINEKFKNQSSITTQIKSSFTKVNIFYNDITFKAYTENASFTWDTLIGNIGGFLGLFIGISVLSLIELIELLIQYLVILLSHRKI